MSNPSIICWFSCGTASALATKMAIDAYRDTCDVKVFRIPVKEEMEDSESFADKCEAWFGRRIQTLPRLSAEEIWKRKRYMAGVKGAPCTSEIKIKARERVVKELKPAFQVFGYTSDEVKRYERFIQNNNGSPIEAPLIREGITKQMCHVAIADAGIRLPEMYRLGFPNNNCIGCVKANGEAYWRRVRKYFPDVFDARCKLSREIGCRLLKVNGKRKFLDEIEDAGGAE